MEGFHIVAGGFTPRLARLNQPRIYLKEGNKISNYHKLYYHVTWAVKNRLPLIVPTLKEPLYSYLSGKTMDFGGIAFAVGGVAKSYSPCIINSARHCGGRIYRKAERRQLALD